MTDPTTLARLAALDALREPASRAPSAPSPDAAPTGWFAADDAGARTPITLDGPSPVGSPDATDIDALAALVLAPVGR